METIGAFDAKSRLSELLERVSRGERFQITKHGRLVGMLVPPDRSRDVASIEQAARRLKAFRGVLRGITREQLLAMRREGQRF
ncbi:MAG: type II toxin-antitoxin system prevent-host-death family antitoxin [Phycisphaeraceae bacterium]|nr:type II toxin-antitoxin system prevent-host-death family antitoxin [Phycisphaeraceae bacterium]